MRRQRLALVRRVSTAALFVSVFPSTLLLAQQGAGASTAPLPFDPAATVGTLSNGMRYYIRENKKPEKRAELRLVVDAGSVLLALTTGAQLIVFEPGDKEFKQLASYKVGSQTYSYPVASGNRIFIKDKDSVTLWTVD